MIGCGIDYLHWLFYNMLINFEEGTGLNNCKSHRRDTLARLQCWTKPKKTMYHLFIFISSGKADKNKTLKNLNRWDSTIANRPCKSAGLHHLHINWYMNKTLKNPKSQVCWIVGLVFCFILRRKIFALLSAVNFYVFPHLAFICRPERQQKWKSLLQLIWRWLRASWNCIQVNILTKPLASQCCTATSLLICKSHWSSLSPETPTMHAYPTADTKGQTKRTF